MTHFSVSALRRIRLLRFAAAGLTCAAFQLALLTSLTGVGWNPLAANAVALLISAQLNFLLGSSFTWPDRDPGAALLRRWLLFHLSIAGTAAVNMGIFSIARSAIPTLPAAALGVGAAAVCNYLLGDRLVFRRSPLANDTTVPGRAEAA